MQSKRQEKQKGVRQKGFRKQKDAERKANSQKEKKPVSGKNKVHKICQPGNGVLCIPKKFREGFKDSQVSWMPLQGIILADFLA